ncbi:hypothetical protein C0J52_07911 [Blattella germanica]|nr:hypothetical protein C0J52_07911 [Blattella germanica]
MEKYEKTISRLVAEKEEKRQAHELDKSSLAKERDTAMGHLGNIGIAFSDLHKTYERKNANQELDSVRRSQQTEDATLKAMLKKAEEKTSSLEEMLEQYVKETQELASICDELINRVGSSQ